MYLVLLKKLVGDPESLELPMFFGIYIRTIPLTHTHTHYEYYKGKDMYYTSHIRASLPPIIYPAIGP